MCLSRGSCLTNHIVEIFKHSFVFNTFLHLCCGVLMNHFIVYKNRTVVRETRTMAFKQLKLLKEELTHSGFEPERIILTAVVRVSRTILLAQRFCGS